MTDQAGLYTADPRKDPTATLIREAKAGDPSLEGIAGGAGTNIGRGGMYTKAIAAKRAARSGAATCIVSGREKEVLVRLANGEEIGTTPELLIPIALLHVNSGLRIIYKFAER